MDLLRGFLTVFALLNAASWAALAAAWAFRPNWSERLPMQRIVVFRKPATGRMPVGRDR